VFASEAIKMLDFLSLARHLLSRSRNRWIDQIFGQATRSLKNEPDNACRGMLLYTLRRLKTALVLSFNKDLIGF